MVVEVGGGLRSYGAGGVDVLDGYGEDERCSSGRGQPLLPWPNRLDAGRYELDGIEHQAPLTEVAAGNAIHGLTRWSSWTLLDATTSSATLGHVLRPQPGWAWTLHLATHYVLADDGLEVTVTARNESDLPCPFGAGFHPYLRAPTGRVDDLALTVPAATRYLADDRGIPTGTEAVSDTPWDFRSRRPIGGQVIDVAYTDLDTDAGGSSRVIVADPASGRSTSVELGAGWSHVMIFTGDTVGARARQGLAVEPMTGPANLLRTGTGLIRLDPGASWSATWALRPDWL